MKSNPFRRLVAGLLVLCLSTTGMLPAYAGIVSTETVIAGAERVQIASFVQRADVQTRLQAMGVNPLEVEARVAALSDAEAALLAAQLDELPAGSGDLLWWAVAIFLILLFTDLMGWTSIFPFTKKK